MSKKLNKKQIERFSRQIILKNIGILGQNKITNAKVLIIGMGASTAKSQRRSRSRFPIATVRPQSVPDRAQNRGQHRATWPALH